MKRQLDSSLYERLLLSRGKENKEEVKRLAEKKNIGRSSSIHRRLGRKNDEIR